MKKKLRAAERAILDLFNEFDCYSICVEDLELKDEEGRGIHYIAKSEGKIPVAFINGGDPCDDDADWEELEVSDENRLELYKEIEENF